MYRRMQTVFIVYHLVMGDNPGKGRLGPSMVEINNHQLSDIIYSLYIDIVFINGGSIGKR